MRKGQEKILKRAADMDYNEYCIKVLSREDLTLKQLNNLLDLLYSFKEESEQWIETFVSIDDYKLMNLIEKYFSKSETGISLKELEQISSREKICRYFSQNNIICKNLFDVELIMEIGYHNYTDALLEIANKIYGRLNGYYEFTILSTVKEIGKCLEYISDYKDFLGQIDLDALCQTDGINNDYFHCCTASYAKIHSAFKLNDAKYIPSDIKTMDFHGYSASIEAKGFFRKVNFDYLQAVYITYAPYDRIDVLQNGDLRINTVNKYYKKLIFNNKTQEFISGYKTKNGYRYKPAQLKELFVAISISETKDDEQNAYSVIDFLCRKYNTYIFKDLYKDFLMSDGLLLPILITDAAKYHTKHELFTKFYHMPIKGNWNKKNANLTYIILKLKNRMTEAAIARSLQCANAPKLKKSVNNDIL